MSTTGSETRRAVIMAGGVGSRLLPHTRVLPKPLMLVNGMPLLDILIRQLRANGFDHVTLSLGYLGRLIRSYCGDGERFGVRLDYVQEEKPEGTAGALRLLRDFDESVLVVNGDLLTDLDFGQMLDDHRASSAALTIAAFQRHHDVPFGVLEFDGDRRMTRFEERPRLSHWVSAGIYGASPEVLDFMPAEGPVGFDKVVNRLNDAGTPPHVHPFEGVWLDLAHPPEFARAEEVMNRHGERLLRNGAK
jgi:NDP-mannose synthase